MRRALGVCAIFCVPYSCPCRVDYSSLVSLHCLVHSQAMALCRATSRYFNDYSLMCTVSVCVCGLWRWDTHIHIPIVHRVCSLVHDSCVRYRYRYHLLPLPLHSWASCLVSLVFFLNTADVRPSSCARVARARASAARLCPRVYALRSIDPKT